MHEIDSGFTTLPLWCGISTGASIFYTRYTAMQVIHQRSPNLLRSPRGVVKRSYPLIRPVLVQADEPTDTAGAVWSFRCRLRDKRGDRRKTAMARREGVLRKEPSSLGSRWAITFSSATRMAIRWNSLTASALGWKSCVARSENTWRDRVAP